MSDDKQSIILIKESQENVAQLILFAVESNFNLRGHICNDLNDIFKMLDNPNVEGVITSSNDKNEEEAVEILNLLSHGDKPYIFVSLEDGIMINWEKHPVPKPDAILARKKCINEIVAIFNNNYVHEEAEALSEYTRISMSPLAHFQNIDEDIYIKLISGRFLKLFSEGDNVSVEDIHRYQSKGLQELYIRRNAYKWILSKLAPRMEEYVEDPNLKIDMEEIKSQPLNDTDTIKIDGPVDLETEFLEFLHTRSEQLVKGMMKSKSLSKYLKKLRINRKDTEYLHMRISLVSNIACGILQKLEWTQTATFEKMLYVIHTHDISLLEYPELMKFQTEAELDADGSITPEQKEIFMAHPEKSVIIVHDDPFAPEEVAPIIMQHHELQGGEGFPNKVASSKIHRMAVILIIALDFAERIIRNERKPPLMLFRDMKSSYKSAGFVNIIKALEEILDPTKSRSGKIF